MIYACTCNCTLIYLQESKQRELSDLEKKIQKKQSELDAILPRFQQHRDQEERLDSR